MVSDSKKKFFNPINLIIILTFLIITGYIYVGFYYPDITVYRFFWIPMLVLKSIRVLFPILVIGILVVYYYLYTGKVNLSSVILLSFSLFFMILLLYPIADYVYRKSFHKNLKKYHSYLQLAPQLHHNINKDDFNIFCLGGSTTEFKDEKGRDWPSLLEKLLNEKYPGRKIKVYNSGKQWYTSQHILINYIQNLRKYKPDILLVMENINDLLHNADFSFLSNGDFREDYGNFLGPSIRLVKSKSLIEFTGYLINKSWYQQEPKEINLTDFPGLISFERNLVTLIKLAKDDSTKVILMTQPNIYKADMDKQELRILNMLNNEAIGSGKKWSYQTAFDGLKKYNNKIIEVAAEEKVQLIDLESMVPKSMEYFYDDVHYRSKAYDLISEKILDELEINPGDHY